MGKTYKDSRDHDEDRGSFSLAKKLEAAKRSKASFRCTNCGELIPGNASGSDHRNHCPACLYSKHVDAAVGNRLGSSCNGRMMPVALRISEKGDIQIQHRCLRCSKEGWNRISADDNFDTLNKLVGNNENLKFQLTEAYYGKGYRQDAID